MHTMQRTGKYEQSAREREHGNTDRKARRRVVMGQDKWETPNRMVQVEIGLDNSRQEKGKNNTYWDKKTKENSKKDHKKKLKRESVTKKSKMHVTL